VHLEHQWRRSLAPEGRSEAVPGNRAASRREVEGEEFQDWPALDVHERRSRTSVPSYPAAVRLAGLVGTENLLGAYFLGDVHLIEDGLSQLVGAGLDQLLEEPATRAEMGRKAIALSNPHAAEKLAEIVVLNVKNGPAARERS